MNNRRAFRPWALLADAATGLAIFLFLAGVLTCSLDGRSPHLSDALAQAHAHSPLLSDADYLYAPTTPVPLAMVTNISSNVPTDRTSVFVVLAAVFSLLFAANVAFYRHLRTQYSRPRSRRKRS